MGTVKFSVEFSMGIPLVYLQIYQLKCQLQRLMDSHRCINPIELSGDVPTMYSRLSVSLTQ
jgi:hypothetical protein